MEPVGGISHRAGVTIFPTDRRSRRRRNTPCIGLPHFLCINTGLTSTNAASLFTRTLHGSLALPSVCATVGAFKKCTTNDNLHYHRSSVPEQAERHNGALSTAFGPSACARTALVEQCACRTRRSGHAVQCVVDQPSSGASW